MKDMNYKEFIQNILNTRGRFACGEEYHERHHIKPRCLGGTDEEENLIDLFAKEHYEAHKLLSIENPNEDKLVLAWWCMSTMKRGGRTYRLSSEEYEESKAAFSLLVKGKSLSEEHRKKIGKANTGHFVPESVRQAVAKANANRVWSEESKQKLSNTISGENHPWFGRHHTKESRAKISEAQKGLQAGEKNPRALIMIQFDKDDNLIKVWQYAKLASKELKIHYGDISRCANGFLKSAGGYHWKYLYDNKLNGEIIPGAITLGLITEEEALKQLEQNNN